LFLVVSTSAVDCLERLVAKMTCYVSGGTLNPAHSLIHSPMFHILLFFRVTYSAMSLNTSVCGTLVLSVLNVACCSD